MSEDAQGSQPKKGLRSLPLDRYRDFKSVGEGGMGIVYWALDTDLNREVALKVIRLDTGSTEGGTPAIPLEITPPDKDTPASQAFETLKSRFLQEAWVTGGMSHPGIVPVYELGQTPQGVPYYTMRFVKGEQTLANAIDDAQDGEFEQRIQLLEPFLKVCDAIKYAHARGVIHRDLKPDNVALGEFGEVVVLDWGLAKLKGKEGPVEDPWQQKIEEYRAVTDMRTAVGILGTPGYLPPEAARGALAEIDHQSDVYSLGVILFQLLTGQLPFTFSSFYELVHQLTQEDAPRAADIDPDIPESLSALCAAALARDKTERLESVAELARRVRAWQAQRLVEQELAQLERDARAALAACDGLSGDALVRQVERVQALVARMQHRDPENAVADEIRHEAERLREQGIQERERVARRRVLTRGGVAVLVVAVVAAVFVAGVLNQRRRQAEDAEADTRAALIESEGATLLTESLLLAPHNPKRSMQLAVEGARKHPGDLAMDALITAIEAVRAKDGRLSIEETVDPDQLARLEDATDRLERGDLLGARAALERSLVDATETRSSALVCMALDGLGRYAQAREAYPDALSMYDLALGLAVDSGRPGLRTRVLLHQGETARELGDLDQARRVLDQALLASTEEGDTPTRARVLTAMCPLAMDAGDFEEAKRYLEEALSILETYPDPHANLAARVQAASIDLHVGNADDALARLEPLADWFARYERSRATLAGQLCKGEALLAKGRGADALPVFEATAAHAADAGYARLTLDARLGAARSSLLLEDWPRAIEITRVAVRELPEILRGLAFRQSFQARSVYAQAYELGLGGAVRMNDPESVLFFLESARGWTVLDTLWNRDAMADTTTSPRLALDEARVRQGLAQALAAERRARMRMFLKEARVARKALQAARREMGLVFSRVDRTRRAAAELEDPVVVTLEDVRALLGAGDALVTFGESRIEGKARELVALYVTKNEERVVELGSVDALQQIIESANLGDSDSTPDEAIAALRARVSAPLELPSTIKRVLVSPIGLLTYVPVGLLFPEHEAVFISSASIQSLLTKRHATSAGDAVLALGDPDYAIQKPEVPTVRGPTLTALPATRDEALAVGDVVLLGEKATISEFRRVIATKRGWRAVHFGCHGLLSAERPFESALALSYEPETGGFLTLYDVVRSSFHADLATLSACETGRGRLYRGEGVLSFPQGFFVAGTPRVICALWKVDDEATVTLMTKFYRLWNPRDGEGIPAAAALKQAQAYVRDHPDHPEWKHPFYWASWVLWGLPD